MEILEIIRDALPEAIGGLIVAAIVALIGYLYTRWRKTVPKPVGGETVPPSPLKPPAPKIPHNLPQPGEFIGREREKAEVREALSSRWPLICIDGIGGIGKTALALEVANRCLRACKGEIPADGIPTFDAFVWTTAKDRELALSDILDTIARTLDYPYIAQLPPEEKPSEAAKLLRAQKCLLIVDNFETITDDAVRDFLLNLPEPSKALITSREQKLHQARAISLRGMEKGEALALIRSEGKRLGLPAVEKGDKKVLLRLYEATGGAPLAIKWAVGQMKQRGQSLDTVLDYLYEARGDIFENIFARSWGLLSENAKRVLMVMPIFATSASKEAIEAASDVHKWDLDEALGQLVEMWLVEASEELDEARRRYSIHPLTRAFAGAKLGQNAEFETGVRLRVANYFLDLVKQYGGENKADYITLEPERENILAILAWCCDAGECQMAVELMSVFWSFLWLRGYWHEGIEHNKQVITVCKKLGRYPLYAQLVLNQGWIFLERGDYEVAKSYFNRANTIFKALDDRQGVADSIWCLGLAASREENMDMAQRLLEESLTLMKQIGSTGGIARVQTFIGEAAYHSGNYDEAQERFEQTLQIDEESNDRVGLTHVLRDLGNVARERSQFTEASHYYARSLAIAQELDRQDAIGTTKLGMAILQEKLGNYDLALNLAQESLEILERLGLKKEIQETRELVERLESRIAEARK